MEHLTLKSRKPVMEESIESWDDDDLDIGGDDFTFRSASIATTAPSHHRDSISSRLSIRSDFDSNHGDEEKHVHLPEEDDERSTIDAIATAKRAGIPIPLNVPTSALMGGTIKRLGGRKIKRVIQDDWDDGDLELPGEGGLRIKNQDAFKFPDTLRHVSGPTSAQLSPPKSKTLQPAPVFNLSSKIASQPQLTSANLERFRDDDDDDFFGDPGTIKVAKSRQGPKLIPLVTPPTPQGPEADDDDFDKDFQLPADNGPLKLTFRKEIPRTPVSNQDDCDEWGEGSLGTRFGGTRRDGRSNRSSSISALSPSVSNVSSALTAESEDEGLDGLVLPTGPLRFGDILKKRQQHSPSEHPSTLEHSEKSSATKDDFLSGLEIGDGDVFSSKKLTLNRNVKIKTARQTSPSRLKTAVSLTFTNKPPPSVSSRLPRPHGSQDRVPSSLEPVSESGGPIARNRRSQSRIGGHSAQSSTSSIPTPTTPSSMSSLPPSTPRRRELSTKFSSGTLRNEPTTTNAQLLKLKRSMPILRSYPDSPAKPSVPRFGRPLSRTDTNGRPSLLSRPKTPTERDQCGVESSSSHIRKHPTPFLPAGSSASQSHHITSKTSRHFRRHDSESSNHSGEFRPSSRAFSRSTMRSPSPRRTAKGPEALAREAATKRQITKPVRRRHFGDGCELDGFDDLPTSQHAEQKFVKQPIARGAPKSLLRNMIQQNAQPDRTASPVLLSPFSPTKASENLPRFARDTAASRMAREHVLSQRTPSSSGAPLTALTNQWKAQVSAKTGLTSNTQPSTKAKKTRGPPQKPQLIKPLGNINNPRSIKGMRYDPDTFRWVGNEYDLNSFDVPTSSPTTSSTPSYMIREKENATPRPALITNINASQGVQVVGGMVFDPQRMCWLKMAPQSSNGQSDAGDMDGFDAFDEEDVFKDVPDLEDSPSKNDGDTGGGRKSEGLKDEWLVGEEFDVGPEFVKRQREEEERWRRKCERWVGSQRDLDGDAWRWTIRDVVSE